MIVSSLRSTKDKREVTRVFYGVETVISTVIQFLNQTNNVVYACVDQTRPILTLDILVLKNAFQDAKNRGVRLLYITEITKDNLTYCKQLMEMTHELRHLDGIKGNFYISESGYLAPATLHEKGKPASQIIYSNVNEIIEHQKYVFDSFWNRAIPAEQRIKEIEEGLAPEFYEVITDPEKAAQTITDLVKSVKKEALFFLPNDKALVRVDKLGLIDYVMKASQSGATVKIICPLSGVNAEIVRRISERAPEIQVLNGNNSPYGMYIGDSEKFIRAELRNPSAERFSESVGFMVYSNRKTSVDSFKSIFELLWNERTLNEELKKAYKMQKEFISIASHELRTPTQAILGMSGLLQYYPEKKDKLIEIIQRNAKRLQTLTENILDLTRIESQTFQLEKERFNIYELLSDVIKDFTERIKSDNKDVRLVYDQKDTDHHIIVEADKVRITQVLLNILNNALKFTNEGQIIIRAHESSNKKEIIVSITDTGSGINKDIFAKLFSKFATKSSQGTGLGLYISKSIIEAHGGRIWAENNADGRGAIFMFTLPVVK
ncbi:MAG TPA: HAMP domain-containing sensor histidine kinase [Nitrososphaeraceae archaeon]|nr:HAMP domain-containing sensor histidine kinase [Nitrososphaeraceae archaeon]